MAKMKGVVIVNTERCKGCNLEYRTLQRMQPMRSSLPVARFVTDL